MRGSSVLIVSKPFNAKDHISSHLRRHKNLVTMGCQSKTTICLQHQHWRCFNYTNSPISPIFWRSQWAASVKSISKALRKGAHVSGLEYKITFFLHSRHHQFLQPTLPFGIWIATAIKLETIHKFRAWRMLQQVKHGKVSSRTWNLQRLKNYVGPRYTLSRLSDFAFNKLSFNNVLLIDSAQQISSQHHNMEKSIISSRTEHLRTGGHQPEQHPFSQIPHYHHKMTCKMCNFTLSKK